MVLLAPKGLFKSVDLCIADLGNAVDAGDVFRTGIGSAGGGIAQLGVGERVNGL